MKVTRLVRAAPADCAALDLDRYLACTCAFISLGRARVERINAGLRKAQVDLRASERLLAGRVVEIAQQAISELRRARGTGHPEDVATIGDLHAEAQFDLAQVCVEWPAQIG